MYVQVNIGRNYNTSNRESLGLPPLTHSDREWALFVTDIVDALNLASNDAESPLVEVHYGQGGWLGDGEESAHVSSFHAAGFDLDHLRGMIGDARFAYSQDAIALIIGSELIGA